MATIDWRCNLAARDLGCGNDVSAHRVHACYGQDLLLIQPHIQRDLKGE
ncbi:hypothetical protein SynA1560_02147 [Synechococcus sp. A15-60]|nr:hypothetical protein SynA1560_02147 [Synechococcus sp. A15-60]